MIHTDGIPTIAWADPEQLDTNRDHGDETSAPSCPLGRTKHVHKVELTDDEIELLAEALDSHRYWQLSDTLYRNNGFVHEPGSDDPDTQALITQTEVLEYRLRELIAGHRA